VNTLLGQRPENVFLLKLWCERMESDGHKTE